FLAKPCTLAELARAIDAATGVDTADLEDVVRRRLGDVAGGGEEAERALTARLLRTFLATVPAGQGALEGAAAREGPGALAARLPRTFLATAPAGLAAVEGAAARQDAAALEAAAHRLGGAAATLGAD